MAKQKTKKEDNTLPVLTHILAIFTGFLGPLIVLLATEDKNVKKHSKNALNWQISYWIYMIAGVIFTVVSFFLVFVYIGFLLLPLFVLAITALIIIDLVFCIIAAVKAGEGKLWAYPLAIPFFKN